MKRFRMSLFAILAIPACFVVALLSGSGLGQVQDPPKASPPDARRLVKPTILILDNAGKATANLAAIDSAVSANIAFSDEISWMFGGKQQKGWYLYAPLIRQLLGTEDMPASKGFAVALAHWQQTSGLNPTGVLDEDSLGTMIVKW